MCHVVRQSCPVTPTLHHLFENAHAVRYTRSTMLIWEKAIQLSIQRCSITASSKFVLSFCLIIVAQFTNVACGQLSEHEKQVKLRRAEMAMGILDGSINIATSSRSSYGPFEIPPNIVRLMRLAKSPDLKISEEQLQQFQKTITQYVQSMYVLQHKHSGDDPASFAAREEGTKKLRAEFYDNVKGVLLPFQVEQLDAKLIAVQGLPDYVLRNLSSWDIQLEQSETDEIRKKAIRLGKELEEEIAKLKEEKARQFLESLPDEVREKVEESISTDDYVREQLPKIPANVLIFQFQSVKKMK